MPRGIEAKSVSEINFVNNCEEYESIVGWAHQPNNEANNSTQLQGKKANSSETDHASMPLCLFASKSVSCWHNNANLHKKVAFTLAEVLITLGIIGVVAALTLPTIIQNYKKSVIETSVKKFYTNINQAIIMSERDNGDMHEWSRTDWDGDGASTWDAYFDKYMVTIKRLKTSDGKNTIFVFSDGSGLRINASDFFWCVKADYVDDFYKYNKSAQCMLFGFYPTYPVSGSKDCVIANYRDKGVEPYIHGNSNCSRINDPEYLCNGAYKEYYYARALQINGWKFPKNCQIGH